MMSKVKIYGILNVTPDSFSDGGKYVDTSLAVEHALKMIEDGADVIDVGGMSTRPGFFDVSVDEECSRIIPVIKEIRSRIPSIILSVDTFRAATANAAIDEGAVIVNDITGLQKDPDMASVIADNKVEALLMRDGFGDADESWEITLQRTIDAAKNAGIPDNKITLDPGVGFTYLREQDTALIKAIPDIKKKWGYPILVGVSRKRVTSQYYACETAAEDRDGASIALALKSIELGADAVRVHNVKQTYAAIHAYDSINGDD